jgi:ABC-type lipoprotein export system ATPase subunit
MAAGYLQPTSGRVSVNLPVTNDGLEYVIQAAPLLDHRSALDNACLARLIKNGPEDRLLDQGRRVLTKLGLKDQLSSPVHRLSGGERQRVAIARAAMAEPALLLADEPTAALDGRLRDVVMDVLLNLLDAGSGIVIATHDPDVAARCDEVLMLSANPRSSS